MLRQLKFAKENRAPVILGMALAIVIFGRLPLEAQNTAVSGVVKNASGQPVAGAVVKVQGADSGLTFLVVSQAQGRYATPNLLPGRYTVQGVGGGYQSEPAGPVEVASGREVKMDLDLKAPQKTPPPEKKMTNADYAKLMPEGDGKQLIMIRCSLCHGLDRPVGARHTPELWQKTVNRMAAFLAERPDLGGAVSDQQREMITDYMAKNFGPETPRLPREKPPEPNEHFPRALLQGAGAKYVAVEFDPRSRTDEYEIGVDSQGIAWVTAVDTDLLGRFDPRSLTFTRIALPPGKVPRQLAQVAADPQDQIWILDNGPTPDAELLRYNPQTKEFKTYAIPAPPTQRAPLNTLRFVDGNVWGPGNSSSRIVKLDPNTGKVTDWHVPGGSHPYGFAIGPDKTIWYTAMYNNEVVKFDPDTGKLTPHKVPTGKSELRRMQADAEGNLWVTAQDTGNLVRLDPRSGRITNYPVPTKDSGPYGVDVDTTRNLIWFSERESDRLGRFDPRANTFEEFPLPRAGTASRRVLVDPAHRNRIWWNGTRFGYLEVIN